MLTFFKKKKVQTKVLHAYVSGTLQEITCVPDAIFSKKLMGDGVSIIALDTTIYAPTDGIVSLIAPTQHALALQTQEGVQLLIHIGLDSELHQDGVFNVLVEQGDFIKCGTPLIEIADAYIRQVDELYIPMIIVENPNNIRYTFDTLNTHVIGGKTMIGTYE